MHFLRSAAPYSSCRHRRPKDGQPSGWSLLAAVPTPPCPLPACRRAPWGTLRRAATWTHASSTTRRASTTLTRAAPPAAPPQTAGLTLRGPRVRAWPGRPRLACHGVRGGGGLDDQLTARRSYPTLPSASGPAGLVTPPHAAAAQGAVPAQELQEQQQEVCVAGWLVGRRGSSTHVFAARALWDAGEPLGVHCNACLSRRPPPSCPPQEAAAGGHSNPTAAAPPRSGKAEQQAAGAKGERGMDDGLFPLLLAVPGDVTLPCVPLPRMPRCQL